MASGELLDLSVGQLGEFDRSEGFLNDAAIPCAGTPVVVPLAANELLPIIVPVSFATVRETARETVTLVTAGGISYAEALDVAWDDDIGRFILTVDGRLLPPGTYRLAVPLGNGETVEMTIAVGNGG